VKAKVVEPEELNKSDLRASSYFQKEPSAEMTVVDLRAKLSTYPPVDPAVLKAYFEYAFEDLDGYEDLTRGEQQVITPEDFRKLHNWVFGVKEEPHATGL
jgi:hypothetical protein